MSTRKRLAAVVAGATVVLGAAGVVALNHGELRAPLAGHEQAQQGPDVPGTPDLPEPGDTPDAGD